VAGETGGIIGGQCRGSRVAVNAGFQCRSQLAGKKKWVAVGNEQKFSLVAGDLVEPNFEPDIDSAGQGLSRADQPLAGQQLSIPPDLQPLLHPVDPEIRAFERTMEDVGPGLEMSSMASGGCRSSLNFWLPFGSVEPLGSVGSVGSVGNAPIHQRDVESFGEVFFCLKCSWQLPS
jgi:hypothetical protein